MSLREVTPLPPRPPTLADAVHADSDEARRLIVQHVRKQDDVRAAFWKQASDATLNRRPQISTAQKPKVNVLHQGCR